MKGTQVIGVDNQNYPNPEFKPTGGNSTFLGNWPTPAETQMKTMMGNMIEQIMTKFMNMSR